ncbi:MAG: PD-(D/E)XK nuclease family protein [Defluviitaleaceae bacterium]|nr:PD-(D/E)XK nuclease family protein [Defluviitaleaceae bacterium]
MQIQFILGGPGTGKSTYVLQEMCRAVQSDFAAPLYYLVPEQFSLQSERLLLEAENGRAATTRVQVLSFNRLAHRLFSVLGGLPGKHADDLGKQMLLRKVIFEVAGETEFYKSATDKQGFVSELGRTITELNHYRVSAADLRDRAADSTPAFAAKLRDIATILQKYREAVTGRHILTDDMPEILCNRLAELPPGESFPLLDGAMFWIDGFSGFTPQERHVLQHILKRAEKITLTLTLKDEISRAPRDTIEKIETFAHSLRAQILPHIHMKENFRHVNAPGLRYFVNNFGLRPPHPNIPLTPTEKPREARFLNKSFFEGGLGETFFSKKVSPKENIEIISSADKYGGVYAAAHSVLRLREKGYRFRDIAILCGDREQYEKILQTVFDREKIPVFVDTEIDILSHPLTELIRAALDIFVKNWSIESVFRFLKTGLAGADRDTIDILENYALANGINSYRWRYEFHDEIAEAGREILLRGLAPLTSKKPNQSVEQLPIESDSRSAIGFCKSSDTVKNYSKRVFDMLFGLNVPETLQSWFDTHMLSGDPQTARIHGQIWPKICEVFDKLVEILGDEKVELKTFAATLDAGFVQVGLGRIPPTLDQVVLGDIARSRYPQIKAMIVLGANDGVLLPTPTQSGLFTDHERKLLNNSGINAKPGRFEVAPENAVRISEQTYNLFCALSQPSEKLILIYSAGEAGKPLRPSPIVKKIQALFPGLETTPAPLPSEDAADMSVFFAPVRLSSPNTAGSTIFTAATRLEAFARCPFAYYMDYLLRVRPRKYFEVLPADLGKLFHEVIADFTKRGNFDATRDEINAEVNALVDALDLENSIFYSSARNKYVLDKVRRVAAASCHALCRQIKNGQYRPGMTEQEILHNIALNDGRMLSLSGRVDRVDFSDTNQIRIVDYKSGATKFSPDEALKGVQLQLVLYMNALLKSRPNSTPGGIFYFPVGDPIIDTNEILPDVMREDAIFKAFKMSGMEADDPVAFTNFGAEVENSVKELGIRMFDGDISARPWSTKKSPCDYCNFDGVCGGCTG